MNLMYGVLQLAVRQNTDSLFPDMNLEAYQKLPYKQQMGMALEARHTASLIKAQHFDPLTDYGWFAAAPLPFNVLCMVNAGLIFPASSVNPEYLIKRR